MDGIKPTLFVQSVSRDAEGNIIKRNPVVHNALLSAGKRLVGLLITSLASGGFTYLCVGASSTPAIDQTSDDRLGGTSSDPSTAHEYIGNAARKPLLSVLSPGNPISSSDWVADVTTISGVTYHQKLEAYVTFDLSDGNNGSGAGNPMRRIGLNTSPALPASVTGKSGIMLNELIDTSDQFKNAATTVTYYLSLRI